MVLLSQIGALAGFTYTSWKIIGQWYRFRTKNEARQDDGYVFTALEQAIATAKADAKAGRAKADYGAGAAASGHAHVFAEWAKLPMAAKVQLVEDLARLAEWSGQANKVGMGHAGASGPSTWHAGLSTPHPSLSLPLRRLWRGSNGSAAATAVCLLQGRSSSKAAAAAGMVQSQAGVQHQVLLHLLQQRMAQTAVKQGRGG